MTGLKCWHMNFPLVSSSHEGCLGSRRWHFSLIFLVWKGWPAVWEFWEDQSFHYGVVQALGSDGVSQYRSSCYYFSKFSCILLRERFEAKACIETFQKQFSQWINCRAFWAFWVGSGHFMCGISLLYGGLEEQEAKMRHLMNYKRGQLMLYGHNLILTLFPTLILKSSWELLSWSPVSRK